MKLFIRHAPQRVIKRRERTLTVERGALMMMKNECRKQKCSVSRSFFLDSLIFRPPAAARTFFWLNVNNKKRMKYMGLISGRGRDGHFMTKSPFIGDRGRDKWSGTARVFISFLFKRRPPRPMRGQELRRVCSGKAITTRSGSIYLFGV